MKKKLRLAKSTKITKQKVWKVFSEYIRLKYMNENGIIVCYTCGKEMTFKEAQAGHAIAGRTNSVLFDEEIIRPQCTRCNIFLHGNYTIFTTKLIKENGMEWWEEKIISAKQVKKFTRDELQEKYDFYKSRIVMLKELKNSPTAETKERKNETILQ